jgi:hypothetical protein
MGLGPLYIKLSAVLVKTDIDNRDRFLTSKKWLICGSAKMIEFYSVQLIGCDNYYWAGTGGILSWGY